MWTFLVNNSVTVMGFSMIHSATVSTGKKITKNYKITCNRGAAGKNCNEFQTEMLPFQKFFFFFCTRNIMSSHAHLCFVPSDHVFDLGHSGSTGIGDLSPGGCDWEKRAVFDNHYVKTHDLVLSLLYPLYWFHICKKYYHYIVFVKMYSAKLSVSLSLA